MIRSNRLQKLAVIFLLANILYAGFCTRNISESIVVNNDEENFMKSSHYFNDFPDWITENYSLISNIEKSFRSASSVDVQGNFAYLAADDDGLVIVNITNTANPQIVSIYRQENVNNVKVQGNFAYITGGYYNGLEIIDIFDPSNPRKVGQHTKTYYLDLWIDGSIAYLVSDINGLRVCNISNPSEPVEIGRIGAGTSSSVSIFVKDKLVFTGERYGGMNIYDCSDPIHPKLLGKYRDSSYRIDDICISNDCAYLADFQGVVVVNIKNLENPVFQYYFMVNALGDIAVQDDFLFVSSSTLGIKIYELNEVGNPEFVTVFYGYYSSAIDICENKLFILYFNLDKYPLEIVDISDITNPEIISTLRLGKIEDIEILGNYCFLLNDKYNIRVYNFETINEPEYITEFSVYDEAYDIEIWGSTIFYFHTSYIFTIDITDIENPISYSYLSQSLGGCNDFKVRDQLIYVLNSQDQLAILNYSDITQMYNAEIIGALELDSDFSDTYEIIIDGNFAYILGRNSEYNRIVEIVDISNPEFPIHRSSYQFTSSVDSITVYSDTLFAAGSNILFILSVINPDSPTLLTEYPYTTGYYGIDAEVLVNENVLYLVTSDAKMEALNVSNPINPELLGYFDKEIETHLVEVELYNNEYICYAIGWEGVDIVGKDRDSDGLSDILEGEFGSNSLNNDSDSDLLSDGLEVHYLLSNPLLNDSDFDNLTDTDEYFIYNTNPALADTDHDQFSDYIEIMNGTNPLNPNDPIWQYTTPSSSINLYFPINEIFIVLVVLYFTKKKRK
ncbi:MAG: hypothetical protein FK733_13300 [Asgard group archaeon]|nr:hypothetical protein [Asgard group archaeon]